METNTREYKLALEIAHALNDMDSLQLHLKYSKKYSEEFLRSRLTKVLMVPENKIRVSRAALYVSLVSRGGYDSTNNFRN